MAIAVKVEVTSVWLLALEGAQVAGPVLRMRQWKILGQW